MMVVVPDAVARIITRENGRVLLTGSTSCMVVHSDSSTVVAVSTKWCHV